MHCQGTIRVHFSKKELDDMFIEVFTHFSAGELDEGQFNGPAQLG